jgi:hypothetical protein
MDLLEGSVFSSYLVPGLVLSIVVGGSGLLAMAAEWRKHPLASEASVFAGVMIVAYEVVEIVTVGAIHWLQYSYVALGAVIIALASYSWWKASSGEDMVQGRAVARQPR